MPGVASIARHALVGWELRQVLALGAANVALVPADLDDTVVLASIAQLDDVDL